MVQVISPALASYYKSHVHIFQSQDLSISLHLDKDGKGGRKESMA